MSKKTWIIFAAICVIVLGTLVYFSTKDRLDVSGVDISKISAASEQSGNIGEHVYGNKDSKVVFIEYGDYQCPGCGAAFTPVKDTVEKYKDKIAFVFRNFPLTSIHPNAKAAAAAAEAAGLQGKFWEMHDVLYKNQDSWNQLNVQDRTNYFIDQASDLKINVDTFKQDMAASNVNKKINFDIALGKKAEITSTPSFFIGDQKLSEDDLYTNNSFDTEKLDELLSNKIAEK